MSVDNGWIKLHRKLLENALWQDCTSEQKVIMITLLLMANHKEKKWIFGGEEYTCQPGQFVTSLKSIQEKTGKDISISQIRRCLEKFEKYGFSTSKPTNKNRLITIAKWETYQSKDDEPTSKPTSNRQATDKQPTTNKNVRMKECKNKSTIRSTLDDDTDVPKKINRANDFKLVIDAWNKIDGLPKIQKIASGTQRHKMLNARLTEYGIDKVLECVRGVEHSSFLKGLKSDTGWHATFDWIIKPSNFIKILEGNYADREGVSNGVNQLGEENSESKSKESKYSYLYRNK